MAYRDLSLGIAVGTPQNGGFLTNQILSSKPGLLEKKQSEQAWFIVQKTFARAALNRKLGENEEGARGGYNRLILKQSHC